MQGLNFFTKRSNDFKKVFLSTEEGKRVLAHIYKMCGMDAQIHTPGDPSDTSFKAGKHRVGQGIQNILAQDEQDIMTIIRLNKSGHNLVNDMDYDPYQPTKKEK